MTGSHACISSCTFPKSVFNYFQRANVPLTILKTKKSRTTKFESWRKQQQTAAQWTQADKDARAFLEMALTERSTVQGVTALEQALHERSSTGQAQRWNNGAKEPWENGNRFSVATRTPTSLMRKTGWLWGEGVEGKKSVGLPPSSNFV